MKRLKLINNEKLRKRKAPAKACFLQENVCITYDNKDDQCVFAFDNCNYDYKSGGCSFGTNDVCDIDTCGVPDAGCHGGYTW